MDMDKRVVKKPMEAIAPKMDVVEEPVVKEIPVAPPLPPQPKRYICKTTCWVSHRCQMYNPGDIVSFNPGEYVPDHFNPID